MRPKEEMPMDLFQSDRELMQFAGSFLNERIESLERDVRVCLQGDAPFPALLYCFSTIDLFGALLGGDAKPFAATTNQAEQYMRHFMRYTDEQSNLLMKIFRHKVVHLAQPRAVIDDRGRHVSWGIWHEAREHHLKLVQVDRGERQLTWNWSVTWTHRFEISVMHFMQDIRESIVRASGYLHRLDQDQCLRKKFAAAIKQIYDP
jgi:hypothetical protein